MPGFNFTTWRDGDNPYLPQRQDVDDALDSRAMRVGAGDPAADKSWAAMRLQKRLGGGAEMTAEQLGQQFAGDDEAALDKRLGALQSVFREGDLGPLMPEDWRAIHDSDEEVRRSFAGRAREDGTMAAPDMAEMSRAQNDAVYRLALKAGKDTYNTGKISPNGNYSRNARMMAPTDEEIRNYGEPLDDAVRGAVDALRELDREEMSARSLDDAANLDPQADMNEVYARKADRARRRKAVWDEHGGAIAALRERAEINRVAAEYRNEVRKKSAFLHYRQIEPLLSEEAKGIVERGWGEGGGLKDTDRRRFMDLPADQQRLVAPVLYNQQPEFHSFWVAEAGRRLVEAAGETFIKNPVQTVQRGINRIAMDDARYQDWAQDVALIEQATAHKQSSGHWAPTQWVIEAIAMAPYMGAAAVPYAGPAILAAQAANDFEDRVAAAGGDVTGGDFAVAKWLTAFSYAAVEEMQWGTLKGVSRISRAAKAVDLFASLRALPVVADIAHGTVTEAAEEAIQQAIEETFVGYATGADVARVASRASIEAFNQSLGPMLVTAGAARGAHAALHLDGAVQSVEDMIRIMNAARAYGAQAEKSMRGEAVDWDMAEWRDSLGGIARGYVAAGGGERGMEYLKRIGIADAGGRLMVADAIERVYAALNSAQETTGARTDIDLESEMLAYGDSLGNEMQWTEAQVPAALSPDHARRMRDFFGGRDPHTLLERIGQLLPGARIASESGEGGRTFSIERDIEGPDGKKRTQRLKLDLGYSEIDGTSDDPNIMASVVELLANRGHELAPGTWEQMDKASRAALLAEAGLGTTLRASGRYNGGRINVDPGGLSVPFMHEYGHALVAFLRDEGMLTDEDIATLREAFGDARPGVDEPFNEERFSDWLEQGAGSPAFFEPTAMDRAAEKVRGWIDALRGVIGFGRVLDFSERIRQDQLFTDIMEGNWRGVRAVRAVPEATVRERAATPAAQAGADAPANGGQMAQPAPAQEDAQAAQSEAAAPANETAQETARVETGAPAAAPNLEPVTARVMVPDGSEEFDVEYRVVDAADIVTSEMPGHTVYQPRSGNRDTASSDLQISTMAGALYPRELGPDNHVDHGAPVVSPDYQTVAGDGRTRAIRQAYLRGTAEGYREYVAAFALAHGMDADEVARMRAPVLVRVVQNQDAAGIDHIAEISNRTATAGMIEVEQSMQDAGKLTADALALYHPGAGLAAPENRAFLYRFMRDTNINHLMYSDGTPTAAFTRLRQAVLAAVLGPHPMLKELLRSALEYDGRAARVVDGIMDAAPRLVALGLGNEKMSISGELGVALADYLEFRRNGGTDIESFLAQGDMFGARPEAVEVLLREFFARRMSSRAVAAMLDAYADALAQRQEGDMLLGDEDKAKLLRDAAERTRRTAEEDMGRFQLAPTQGELDEARRQYDAVVARYTHPDGTRKPGWMKAPNGKPTRLTERQWVQVRTENFKRWFGDWENDPDNASKVVDENGEPLVVWHGSNWNPLAEEPGRAVFDASKLGSNTRNFGYYGRGFYFTEDRRATKIYGNQATGCFLNLRNPFRSASKEGRRQLHDWFGDDQIISALSAGDGDLTEWFTDKIKELGFDGVIGETVLESEFVAFDPAQVKSATDNAGTFSERGDIRFSLAGVEDVPEADQTDTAQFKRWFGKSKVVDKDGKPLVCAHRTPNDFEAFDLSKSNDLEGRQVGLGWGANKIYLVASENENFMAFREGQRVLRLYAKAENPIDGTEYDRRLAEKISGHPTADPESDGYDMAERDRLIAELDAEIKAEGHDGIWNRETGELAVFEPTQVKHATENIGTFNGSDARMRFSVAGLYTGSAADYANRVPVLDKDGNVTGYRIENGPSLHYVGTGERSQVYGWGLYGSTERGVAETYAAKVSKDTGTLDLFSRGNRGLIDGAFYDISAEGITIPYDILHELEYAGTKDRQELLDEFRSRAEVNEAPFGNQHTLEEMEAAGEYPIETGQYRWLEKNFSKIRWTRVKAPRSSQYIYEQTFFTDRPEGDESHLLKWYEPVSEEQLEWIKSALSSQGGKVERHTHPSGATTYIFSDKQSFGTNIPITKAKGKSPTGRDVYSALKDLLGSPQAASKFLARAGIDGVKYPVDSYGGKGVKNGDEAGWNYVSFRDDNIRVDHKWVDGQQKYKLAPKGIRDIRRHGRESYLVAIIASDMMARVERPPEEYEKLRKALAPKGALDVAGATELARKVVANDRAKAAKRAIDRGDLTAGIESLASQAELAAGAEALALSSVAGGMEVGNAYGRLAQDAVDAAWKQVLKAVKGGELTEVEQSAGMAIVAQILESAKTPEQPRRRKPKADAEAGEAGAEAAEADSEAAAETPEPDASEVEGPSPEQAGNAAAEAEAAERFARVKAEFEAWLRDEATRARRRREARERREKARREDALSEALAEMAEEDREAENAGSGFGMDDDWAGADEESPDADGGEEADEEAVARRPEAIPLEILLRNGIDTRNPKELAALLHFVVRDWAAARDGVDAALVFAARDGIALYRDTMYNILREAARKLLDPSDARAVEGVRDILETMRAIDPVPASKPGGSARSVARIDSLSAQALGRIQRLAIRESQRRLVKAIRQDIKRVVGSQKQSRADKIDEDVRRRIGREDETAARYISRVIGLSAAAVEREAKRLSDILSGRERAYSEAGAAEGAVSEDRLHHYAALRMALLQEYGGLRYRSRAELAAARLEIADYLADGLERHAAAWEAFTRRVDALKAMFCKALEGPADAPRPGRRGWLARRADELTCTLRQRLELATAWPDPDGERGRDRRRAIDEIMLMVSEGSQERANVARGYDMDYVAALEFAAKAGGMTARAFVKHLSEEAPAELVARITRQSRDSLTWGQVLNIYSYLCQTASYAKNIERHGRQGQREAIEAAASPADLRFVQALRETYAARRASLSAAWREITGMDIFSPDPLYMPVRMLVGNQEGIAPEMSGGWNPVVAAFSERVSNSRDVDESRDISQLYFDNAAAAANAIAFGKRGLALRSVLASAEAKDLIDRFRGREERKALVDQLADTLNGGREDAAATGASRALRYLNSLAAYSSLGFNPFSAMKQLTSIPAWAGVLSAHDYGHLFGYILDFDRAAARELMDSPGFVARYGRKGIAAGLRESLEDPRKTMLNKLQDASMVSLQMADLGPGLVVGTGLYKALVRKYGDEGGMDEAAAKRRAAAEVWELIEESQQSDKMQNLMEDMRRGGIIAKSLYKYATSPILQASQEIAAWRNWSRTRGDDDLRKAVNTTIANHVLMPMSLAAVNALARTITGDDDPLKDFWRELLVASLVGSFGKWFLYGSLTEYGLRRAFGLRTHGSEAMPAVQYAANIVNKAGAAMHDAALLDGDKFVDDVWSIGETLASPVHYGRKIIRNAAGE